VNQFDEIIDRTNTNSTKYDFKEKYKKPAEVLPLWLADMDFRTAPGILERLSESVSHGIFGYSESKEDYFEVLSKWYLTHFNWQVEKEWLIKTPGVIFAIVAVIRALTKEGDSVLIQEPVYYPFKKAILNNNREVVISNLTISDGRYYMDFEDFERKIVEEKVKLFILCSPHNPVGRVWTRQELEKIGEICIKNKVYIISDEIHSDFVYAPFRHLVFASLNPDFAKITITCTSPSKTFNLAGLQISNIFISNNEIRNEVQKAIDQTGYGNVNILGLKAGQAAYETGGEWLIQLKQYLTGNLNYLRSYVSQNIPQISIVEPEGTYLVWMDFRNLLLSEKELEKLIVGEAGLWLDRGLMFGEAGRGFERINIACPRTVLETALKNLDKAVKALKKVSQ